jgi:hypothetical protein
MLDYAGLISARSRLAFQPYLTDAAPHLVAFIVGRLAKRLEGMTEFDDIAIAILPIVEGGEIVADGLEISQGPQLRLLPLLALHREDFGLFPMFFVQTVRVSTAFPNLIGSQPDQFVLNRLHFIASYMRNFLFLL